MTRLPHLAAAAALAAGPALADAPPVERLATPEGREVLHVPMPDARYGEIVMLWPGTAALDLPGREGLFTLGAQLPFERAGGRSFDEIDEALRDAGESVFLFNQFHGTFLVLQTIEETFEAGVGIARDVVHEPALDPDDLGWLVRNIEDGLAETERDPQAMAERAMGALVAGDDPRLAALTNRPFESVEAVTVDDVRGWMEATFHDEPLIVSAGPLDEAAVTEAVDAVLGGLPDPSGEPGAPDPVVFEGAGTTVAVRAPEADVALVLVPFLLPTYSAEGAAAFSALAGGEGSRLFERVREEAGASYGLELGLVLAAARPADGHDRGRRAARAGGRVGGRPARGGGSAARGGHHAGRARRLPRGAACGRGGAERRPRRGRRRPARSDPAG